jgi:hypothetical protein
VKEKHMKTRSESQIDLQFLHANHKNQQRTNKNRLIVDEMKILLRENHSNGSEIVWIMSIWRAEGAGGLGGFKVQ